MKTFICALLTIFLISSCATHKPTFDSDYQFSYLTHAQLKSKIDEKVESHEELSEPLKKELKKIFFEALKTSMKLKDQESKLVQSYVDTILKKPQANSSVSFEKKLKSVYAQKMKNILKTSSAINKLLKDEALDETKDVLFDFFDLREDLTTL